MKKRERMLKKKSELSLLLKDNHDSESCQEIDLFIKNEQIINTTILNDNLIAYDGYREWLFLENPFHFSVSAIHINSDRKICNNVTLFPTKSWDGFNQVLSAQLADTFTNKSYLGLGLFDQAVMESIHKMSEKHHHLIYGFPNQYSLPGYIKRMNFELVKHGIKTQIKRTSLTGVLLKFLSNPSIKTIKLLRTLDPLKSLLKIELILTRKNSGIVFVRTNTIDNDFENFWNNEKEKIKLLNARDSKFLNWRYIRNKKDFEVYKIIHNEVFSGFFVMLELQDPLRPKSNNLWLIDWFYTEKNKKIFEKEIINHLKYIAHKRDVDAIIIQQPDSSALEISSNFRTVGKSRPLVIYKNKTGIKYLNQSYPWHFTVGDTDHF